MESTNESIGNSLTPDTINLLSEGLILLDTDGCVMEMNTAAIKTLGDCKGDRIQSLFLDWENIPHRIKSETIVQKGEEFITIEAVVSKQNGSSCVIFNPPVREDYDHIRNKNQFIAFLSHELRNPLQSVVMACRMIDHVNKGENRRIARYQEIISNCCRDMKKIIKDMLDLHKIDTGELSIEDERIETPNLIGDLQSSFTQIVNEKGLKMEIVTQTEMPEFFFSDQVRVTQVVSNLISNAIKYSDEGTITVELDLVEDDITVCISDQGVGIKSSELGRLFREVSQLSNHGKLKVRPESHGLGLVISQKIARLLGGDIVATSTYGHGSSFCFRFPYRGETSLEESIVEPDDVTPVTGKILVVEDSKTNAELIADSIQLFNDKYGFKVEYSLAHNGLEAVQYAQRNPLDLILMDINMEKLDGSQACNIIRKFNKKMPIIALTGNIYARKENRTEESSHRFSQFTDTVIKPCTEHRLISILSKYLPEVEGGTPIAK